MLKDVCYRCMTAALVTTIVLATVLSSGCSVFAPPHSSGGILVIEVPADSGPDAVEADRSTREGEMKVVTAWKSDSARTRERVSRGRLQARFRATCR